MQYSQRKECDSTAAQRLPAIIAGPCALLIAALFCLTMTLAASVVLAEQSPIRVSQDHAWPPFSYINDEGAPEGLLIDL